VVDRAADAASVTVWMNQIDAGLRAELRGNLFQTWNPVVEPAPASVTCDYSFERPVVTVESEQSMAKLHAAQGRGHLWFVGAYSRYSMPLLENGVKSSLEVARRLCVDTSDVEFDEEAHCSSVDAKLSQAARTVRVRALCAAGFGLAILWSLRSAGR